MLHKIRYILVISLEKKIEITNKAHPANKITMIIRKLLVYHKTVDFNTLKINSFLHYVFSFNFNIP